MAPKLSSRVAEKLFAILSICDRMKGYEKKSSFVPPKINSLYLVHVQIYLILKKQMSFQS